MYNSVIQNYETGLTDEQLMQKCPAIFAATYDNNLSSRYRQVRTIDILNVLRDEGYVPTTAMQANARIVGNESFSKHLLRLRHQKYLDTDIPDVPDVVLVNAHNGLASYKLLVGLVRMICANEMIAGDFSQNVRIKHTGDVVGRVVESTLRIVEKTEGVMETVEEMKQTQLSREEQLLLAEFALKARYEITEADEQLAAQTGIALVAYQPQDLLRRIHGRREDMGSDLYTTMNVIQENGVRGGVSRRDKEGKKHTIRPLKDIDKSIRYNQLLWAFSERLLELKRS